MLVGEVWEGRPQVMSVGNYVDTDAAVTDFEHGLSAFNYTNYNLADETAPERVVGARVTANYFDVMGVRPILGRTFTADEDRPGNDRVVVLSHRLWTRRFGASESAVGRELRMNGATYQIAGVMPASFDLTSVSEELWTPIAFTPAQRDARRALPSVYGRLKPGVTAAGAGQADVVAMRLAATSPKTRPSASDGAFRRAVRRRRPERPLTLLAAVGPVLLIACGNVANLLLARARPAPEIAAGRHSVPDAGASSVNCRPSVVLAFCAAGAGLLVARGAVVAVMAWSPTTCRASSRHTIRGARLRDGRRARQQRAVRPGAGAAPGAPRSARRIARRRTRLDGRTARSPPRRVDHGRSRAVAAAARRRRSPDP
jgi:hypothetical protein